MIPLPKTDEQLPEPSQESGLTGRVEDDADDPAQWVETYGDLLFRFAMARVRRREIAEDLVQETLLGAWQSRNRFEGRSSHKTWLFQILKNKIVDYYRRTSREVELDDPNGLEAFEEQQFAHGRAGCTHWERSVAPRGWSHPAQSVENAEFWKTVSDCSDRLPERVGRAFVLRDVDGMETDDICRTLNIKPSHLFVLLHRARLAMRRCLELNWFRSPSQPRTKPD